MATGGMGMLLRFTMYLPRGGLIISLAL